MTDIVSHALLWNSVGEPHFFEGFLFLHFWDKPELITWLQRTKFLKNQSTGQTSACEKVHVGAQAKIEAQAVTCARGAASAKSSGEETRSVFKFNALRRFREAEQTSKNSTQHRYWGHSHWFDLYISFNEQFLVFFSSFQTELYIADLLTNRDDADEATRAYKEAFVSQDAARVCYRYVNQILLRFLLFWTIYKNS